MKPMLLVGIVLIACTTPASPSTEETASQPRSDRYGDPLPKRAIARLGTLRLRGCRGPVVFSPDGKHLVAVGGDAGTQAIFWDLATGQREKILTAKGTILRLVFSPDGKHLAAVRDGGLFNSVWDAANGKELFTFDGQEVAFHTRKKQLVSIYGGKRTTVRTYDVVTGKREAEWDLSHPSNTGLALSPDGRFASISFEGTDPVVAVFDLDQRTEAKRLRFPLGRLPTSSFSSDGRLLVAAGDNGAAGNNGFRVWEWSSGKVLCDWEGYFQSGRVFSGDGLQLAWIGADRFDSGSLLWVMDLASGRARPLRKITWRHWPYRPAFSPDGKRVALISDEGAAVVLDARTGQVLLPPEGHISSVESVAFTPDGRHVVTRDALTAFVWDARTGRLLRRFPDDLPKEETALLSTAVRGRIITERSDDHTLRLRDLATAKEVRPLPGYFFVHKDASAVTADGRWAALLGFHGVRIYDLDKGVVRYFFPPEGYSLNLPVRLNFSADGVILAVETQEERQQGLLTFFLRYYEAETGRQVAADKFAPGWLQAERIWPTTREQLVLLKQRKLLNRDAKPAFTGKNDLIYDVHESPGGRYLVVHGATGEFFKGGERNEWLRMWDSTTRRLVMDQDDKEGYERITGFSSDSRTFVSTNIRSGTIYLWEIATGRERLRLQGHKAGDVRLCFRPDGRAVVSGGTDTQVFLWDVTGRAPDGVWRGTQHSPEQLRQLWEELAGDDAARAYRAMWSLVAAPAQATALIQEHLPPVAAVEPRQLSRLLADLDSDSFAARTKATRELERLGELAEPALRKALEGQPTLEVRRRCGELLDKLSVLSGGRLRAVRAVEILEHLGTAEARELLEKLAQGDPAARLTREARTAAKRSLQGEAGQPR